VPTDPPKTRSVFPTNKKVRIMILSVCAKLKDIYDQGRNFQWVKPCRCPICGSVRVWGHGFVATYFDGYNEPLYLRRYRCPDCARVFLMKPRGYFNRFHAAIDTICNCLTHRLLNGVWNDLLGKSRQRHWLLALKKKAMAWFGTGKDLLAAFGELMAMGVIPVSRGK
jgi:transposase-like protein